MTASPTFRRLLPFLLVALLVLIVLSGLGDIDAPTGWTWD